MDFLCVLNFEKLHLSYMVDLLIKLSEAEFFLCIYMWSLAFSLSVLGGTFVK